MDRKTNLPAYQKMGNAIACGRSLAEQIEDIDRYGGHGCVSTLRNATLAAHGIPKAKEHAANCVIFGCYRPFNTPFFLRDCVRLLELLKIDYTYLDREYCCGAPLLMAADDTRYQAARDAAKSFIGRNLEAARQKGAQLTAYGCNACAHAARDAFPQEAERNIYILDLILDHLADRPLKIKPVTVGYFEGCHAFVRTNYPGGEIDFARYRRLLDRIEGLTVVDLPVKMCCKSSARAIIDSAAGLQLEKLLVCCSGCFFPLSQAAAGRLSVLALPELLLQALAEP